MKNLNRGLLGLTAGALFAALTILSGAEHSAFAQGRGCPGATRYSGPCLDVDLVNREPPLYAECEKFRGKSQPEIFACNYGVDEARRMAQYYGGSNGRMQGFHRGFAWGMNRMVQLNKDDATQLEAGARLADGMGQYIESGLRAGRERGSALGSQDGASEARHRFDAALGTGKMPYDQVGAFPATNYAGEDNGYERFVRPTGPRGPKDFLQNEMGEYNRYRDGAYDAVTDSNRPYVGEFKQLSIWDLWFDDGVYAFETRYWMDNQRAMSTWLQLPNAMRPKYDTLNQNAPEDWERDQNGDIVIGADGKRICKSPIKDPAGVVTGCQKIDVQAAFRESFRNAYGYYVSYYYSSSLYRGLDDGQGQGEVVGTELGKRIALQTGMIRAFNAKFKESSRLAFREAYEQAYGGEFTSTFAHYRDNAILSLEILDVIGQQADGILQPDESFALQFRLVNRGGRGAALATEVSGNVIAAGSYTDAIEPLTSRVYTTGILGRIDPRLRSGQNAQISLCVAGVCATTSETVRRSIALSVVSPTIDVPQGSGMVLARFENVATVRTSSEVVASLTIDGRVVEKRMGFLNPGEIKEAYLEFSGIDPLRLLNGVGAQASVRLTMGDLVMEQRDLSLVSNSRSLDLARYFNQLANDKAYLAGVNAETRRAEVMQKILAINEQETTKPRSNIWKDNPRSTMVGMVRQEFVSTPQSDAAKEATYVMGEEMWKRAGKLGRVLGFLWKSGKRKSYESLARDLRRPKK